MSQALTRAVPANPGLTKAVPAATCVEKDAYEEKMNLEKKCRFGLKGQEAKRQAHRLDTGSVAPSTLQSVNLPISKKEGKDRIKEKLKGIGVVCVLVQIANEINFDPTLRTFSTFACNHSEILASDGLGIQTPGQSCIKAHPKPLSQTSRKSLHHSRDGQCKNWCSSSGRLT